MHTILLISISVNKNILLAAFAKQLPELIADIFHRRLKRFHHNFPDGSMYECALQARIPDVASPKVI